MVNPAFVVNPYIRHIVALLNWPLNAVAILEKKDVLIVILVLNSTIAHIDEPRR